MKTLLKIAVLAVVITMLCCCGAYKRKILATCPTVSEQGSTTVTTTTVDTIVLPADSAIYKALIECQNGKPVLVGEWIDNGVRLDVSSFFVPAAQKPSAGSLVIKALQPQAKVATPKTVTQTDTTYKKEALQVCPGLTGWQWFQIWIGRIAMLLLAIYIILKIVKRFL